MHVKKKQNMNCRELSMEILWKRWRIMPLQYYNLGVINSSPCPQKTRDHIFDLDVNALAALEYSFSVSGSSQGTPAGWTRALRHHDYRLQDI